MRFLKAWLFFLPFWEIVGSPLNFGAPMIVAGSNPQSGSSSPIVVSSAAGFMIIWCDSLTDATASFSTDLGVSWSPTILSMDSSNYPCVAGNQTGFVAAWNNIPPGFGYGMVATKLFDTTSQIWGMEVDVNSLSLSTVPVLIGSSTTGFITTWTVNYQDVYANVSPDGVSWQGTSSQIGTGYGLSSVSGCGNSNAFLVAWNDYSTQTIYTATSTDNGTSWNGPYTAVADTQNPDYYGVGCFANASGFLLAYVDTSGNLWSAFSTNGVDWATPVLISDSASSSSYAIIPSVGGTDAGFVVSWLGADNNAYAALSVDHGATWTNTQITSDGSVEGQDFYSVCVSAYNASCMASWIVSDGMGGYNTVVSVSSFPSGSSSPKIPNSGLFFPVTINKSGFRLN